MELWKRLGMVIVVVLLLVLPLAVACGGDDGDETTTPTQTTTKPTTPTTTQPTETGNKTKVTIGNITDITGPAAVAMEWVDMGVVDAARYYNENNLIPGVEVEVLRYDSQADPAKAIPGWNWLKEHGADAIIGWFPTIGLTLKATADKDKIPLFVSNAPREIMTPPGYLFNTSLLQPDQGWTFVNWLMENDWDYKTKGPAKVGGSGWDSDNMNAIFDEFEKYAQLHPDQMTWVGSQITAMSTFQWAAQVEALKDCDYIFVPNLMPFFIKDYVTAGYTKAKFLATDSSMSFFGMISDMGLWPKIDGMLFISLTGWIGDTTDGFEQFVNKLLQEYHPGSVQEVTNAGTGYNSVGNGTQILEGIKAAAAKVGPENVDSEAIYEGMQSVKISWDGVQRWSYGPDKRVSADHVAILKADGAGKQCVNVSGWIPVLSAPE